MTKENVLVMINESKTICERLMCSRDYDVIERYVEWLKDYIRNASED